MEKKIYTQPVTIAAELDSEEIFMQQSQDPSNIYVYEEEVDPQKKPDDVSSDIWGKAW